MARVRAPSEERLNDERRETRALQSLSADCRRELPARRSPELLGIVEEKARGNLAAIGTEGKILEAPGRISASEAPSEQVESCLAEVNGPQRFHQVQGGNR